MALSETERRGRRVAGEGDEVKFEMEEEGSSRCGGVREDAEVVSHERGEGGRARQEKSGPDVKLTSFFLASEVLLLLAMVSETERGEGEGERGGVMVRGQEGRGRVCLLDGHQLSQSSSSFLLSISGSSSSTSSLRPALPTMTNDDDPDASSSEDEGTSPSSSRPAARPPASAPAAKKSKVDSSEVASSSRRRRRVSRKVGPTWKRALLDLVRCEGWSLGADRGLSVCSAFATSASSFEPPPRPAIHHLELTDSSSLSLLGKTPSRSTSMRFRKPPSSRALPPPSPSWTPCAQR